MVRVIMGVKGTGKTKQMIDLINSAVHSEHGNESSNYDMGTFEFMKGFISGLYAGNYDITHVFIDSLTKIVNADVTDHTLEEFLDWLNAFSEKNNIKFTVTISADRELASEGVQKYF